MLYKVVMNVCLSGTKAPMSIIPVHEVVQFVKVNSHIASLHPGL